MAQFPGSLLRTAIFGWMLVFPKLGNKKRRISNVKDFMPPWYRMALRVYIFSATFTLATVVVLMPILGFLVYKIEG